jgi:hypothetical protein
MYRPVRESLPPGCTDVVRNSSLRSIHEESATFVHGLRSAKRTLQRMIEQGLCIAG